MRLGFCERETAHGKEELEAVSSKLIAGFEEEIWQLLQKG
jgi:hypothetical protein